MSWSGPSSSILYRTFQVVKPLTRDEICSLRVSDVVPLEVGFHGILRHTAIEGQDRYPYVTLCRTAELPQQPEPRSAILSRGERRRVPLDHIKVGNLITENVETNQQQLLRELNPGLQEAHTWIRRRCPAKPDMPECWVFHGAPRHISPNDAVFEFVCREPLEAPTDFSIYLSKKNLESVDLTRVSLVNCVIEITVNPDEKHPCSWLNIPVLGPFDCWSQGSRMGVRIEFLDAAGAWKSLYLQSRGFRQFAATHSFHLQILGQVRTDVNHIEVDWLNCMKIMAALLNWEWRLRDGYTKDV